MPDANALPNDVEGLKRLLLEKERQIEHLKFQLAKLRRARFGQSSERLEGAGQIPLTFEELQAALAEAAREMPTMSTGHAAPEKGKPVRRKTLPEHFERVTNIIEPKACVCPDCGGALSALGKPDESEVMEVKTVTFTVTRHVRPKKRCSKCSTIVQAPAPPRPIERSFAGASLLALVLTWKYTQCRYRHWQYYAASETMPTDVLKTLSHAKSQVLDAA